MESIRLVFGLIFLFAGLVFLIVFYIGVNLIDVSGVNGRVAIVYLRNPLIVFCVNDINVLFPCFRICADNHGIGTKIS